MTVGILGIGLIGGSLARAYALEGHRVFACDHDEVTLSRAIKAGVVTEPLTEENIPRCDLILLSVCPDNSASWLERNAQIVSRHTLVMDCCGVKREVCQRCFPLAEKYGFAFIGGHPMAGSHFSGYAYSREDLFVQAPMVLVPPSSSDTQLVERAKQALQPCRFGSFSICTPEEHDRLIAFTSQMPHILSNAYIKSPTALEHRGYSAGSYQDLTRVAWLNPTMWAELCMENRDRVLFELDTYMESLKAYRVALETQDTQLLTALLDEGRRRKEEVDR